MKVYLIEGNTDDEFGYEKQWEVALYSDKEQAELHLNKLNEYAAQTHEDMNYERRNNISKNNPYDKRMKCYEGGTFYVLREITLFHHLDQFLEQT